MKRLFGVIILLIGLGGMVGALCALVGIFDMPTQSRRGPLGMMEISCAFLYVGWNWIQNKVAE